MKKKYGYSFVKGITKSEFVRNFLFLFSGSSIAQIIPI